MKALFSILAFAFMVLVILCGTIKPIDYQQEKKLHKAEYIAWWLERDNNIRKQEQAWTR
jgi:hypothetical protein